jgi:hypothetical protein
MSSFITDLDISNILYFVCLVILVIVLIRCLNKQEGFEQRPSMVEKEKYVNQLLSHTSTINQGLSTTQVVMPWIDAVTYEDSRTLIREGKFNKQNIMAILS